MVKCAANYHGNDAPHVYEWFVLLHAIPVYSVEYM